MNTGISQLTELIADAERIVAFTGAGISTESGIPDFRSPGGIWSKMAPIQFDEFVNSEHARKEAWRRKIVIDKDFQQAAPNRGHRALAKLVADGRALGIITQNIDGLHQASGVPDDKVIELHGNGTYATCLDCGLRYELAPIYAAFEADETLPTCHACGGLVKAATISFGQAMPDGPMSESQRLSEACDLFIALGSSLVVYPAAGFPAYAKQCGAKLVIVNREATDLDGIADLVVHDSIGDVLGEAVGIE